MRERRCTKAQQLNLAENPIKFNATVHRAAANDVDFKSRVNRRSGSRNCSQAFRLIGSFLPIVSDRLEPFNAAIDLCNFFWVELEHRVAEFDHPRFARVLRIDRDFI